MVDEGSTRDKKFDIFRSFEFGVEYSNEEIRLRFTSIIRFYYMHIAVINCACETKTDCQTQVR